MPSNRLLQLRIALVFLVLLAGVVGQQYGLFAQFAEPARLKQSLLDLGPQGYVAFVVAYALLQPFGVPGTVFIFAAPLIWPWPIAFALSMIGTMSASVIGFSFARFVARDWFARIVPSRFRKYERALESRGFTTVFLLRFVFWMPPLLHAFFGISKVRFSQHFWGSLAGYFVPLLLVSFFGEQLVDAVRQMPSNGWLAIGLGLPVVIVAAWWLRRRVVAVR